MIYPSIYLIYITGQHRINKPIRRRRRRAESRERQTQRPTTTTTKEELGTASPDSHW
jgi:hypothetical protein